MKGWKPKSRKQRLKIEKCPETDGGRARKAVETMSHLENMKKRNIPFSPPDLSELEVQEVAEALRSGWITTGPRVKELEKRLAAFCHTSRVVCLSSATASEELNFRICGIGDGAEVMVA